VESYRKQPWVDEYFKEFMAALNTNWQSYVYFRWKPFKGKYLNINDQGLRFTVPSDLSDSETTKKINIFMFGGSTLWGWGVRDRYTIPSQLVEALAKHKIKAEITNFSEPGYVTTQELIDLIMQLQRGKVPDLVIFYDGVNDVYAAYQSGVAGIPENEWKREMEYNLSNRYGQLRRLFLLKSLDEFYLGRKIKELSQKLELTTMKRKINDGLEKKIVEIYLNNLKIIDGISKTYGFKTMYYWHPIIYYKNYLTNFEEYYNNDDEMKKLYFKTYDILRQEKPILARYNFYDISDILADSKESLYIDYCHLNEEGNKEIAERIANDVINIINTKK
jgi:lysophospholipase L1-like esterase